MEWVGNGDGVVLRCPNGSTNHKPANPKPTPIFLVNSGIVLVILYTSTGRAFRADWPSSAVRRIHLILHRNTGTFLLSLSVLSHVFGAVDKTSSLVFQRTVK